MSAGNRIAVRPRAVAWRNGASNERGKSQRRALRVLERRGDGALCLRRDRSACTRAARSAPFGGAGPTTIASLAHLPPFDLAPHELGFGIVRSDGTYKPVAQTLARFASEKRSVIEPPPAPIVRDEAAYYASLPQGIADVYRAYCNDHA